VEKGKFEKLSAQQQSDFVL
jgi:hypothetical protein